MLGSRVFFGWRVVGAAFVVAVFGWGTCFYGPPVFLHAIHAERGWSISLVSAAVTSHFLLGSIAVANLAALHARFGVAAVTRASAFAAALGIVGWSLAREPWQLFAATALSGAGWAGTGGAAVAALVAPWFSRRRAAALGSAYNGASVGGVVFSPLWVALIAAIGFPLATALVGLTMIAVLWWLAGRYLDATPAALGLHPDGDSQAIEAPAPPASATSGRDAGLWRSSRFRTLALATSLGLFAQIGLIAHLFSLMTPTLGPQFAGFAAGLATLCAILGRVALGWLVPSTADRRTSAAANYAVQVVASLILLSAAGTSVPLLLLGVALFGLALGNVITFPPLIAQAEFSASEAARVVALVTALSQASYAFAPAAFGALRELAPGSGGGGDAPALFLAAAAIQASAAALLLLRRPGRSA